MPTHWTKFVRMSYWHAPPPRTCPRHDACRPDVGAQSKQIPSAFNRERCHGKRARVVFWPDLCSAETSPSAGRGGFRLTDRRRDETCSAYHALPIVALSADGHRHNLLALQRKKKSKRMPIQYKVRNEQQPPYGGGNGLGPAGCH